jgi:hypothetical protein
MTKLCPRGKAAAKRKFKVYPSAYANAYASKICAGKIKDPSGVKRKDFRGSKAEGGLMEATSRLKRQGLKAGSGPRAGRPVSRLEEQKRREKRIKGFPKTKITIIGEDGKKRMGTFNADGTINFRKGGRAGLKGGGLCKRGMNREAIGKNS